MGKVVVLDFGGQYAHLIATRVRRLGVYSEIRFPSDPPSDLSGVAGVVFSGGPRSVHDPDRPDFDSAWLDVAVPILGLCYGHQLLAVSTGGEVRRGEVHEFGAADLQHDGSGALLAGVPSPTRVWMSHGDEVQTIGPDFRVVGSTSDCPHAAIEDLNRRRFGIQFHPEVVHTADGERILSNFLDVCGVLRDWNMEGLADRLGARLREQAEGRRVFLLVSGGVDSTVTFALLNKALGPERVLGLHIDNGLMRQGESAAVLDFLKAEGFNNLRIVDASDLFLQRLSGLVDPESKRRAIGDAFLEVQAAETARLGLDPREWVLAQGTIYPDTIESGGTRHSATIKTHHNRVPAILTLLEGGQLLEPLAELYKDEVRALGERLGIPRALVWRHPFPGPGLGVRLLCQEQEPPAPRPSSLAEAREIARSFGYSLDPLPVRSVGVQGDGRTYALPAALTGPCDWQVLEAVATTVTNRVRDFNRVVWRLAGQGSFAWLAASTTRTRLDLLRRLDDAAQSWLKGLGALGEEVWQMPVVLLPVTCEGRDVVVLRPITSRDAMTARFWGAPTKSLDALATLLLDLGAGAVLWDCTHKPPGTIEWE